MDTHSERVEALGPAEAIIASMTQHVGHAVHNRTGLVRPDTTHAGGAQWQQATWVQEGDDKVVYIVQRVGKGSRKTRVGVRAPEGDAVLNNGQSIGRWQPAGLFPEVVAYIYSQIATVWEMDNEFAAKWASWAFDNEDNRDLKVILAAFMLVQNRFGEPVVEGDERFLDDDYRAVGEAMCLLKTKTSTFNPKLLLRIGDVLVLPQVADCNRRLGFGQSARRPTLGRYCKVIEKWLHNMENNPKILEGWVSGGFRTTIMRLSRKVGFKPKTPRFFQILRWKQVQAKEGHRTLAIGDAVKKADTWEALSEREVCEKIVADRPNWKVIVGKLPAGITPAIMAAAIETGCLSDNDLIILTPTIEELGLLEQPDIAARWKAATEKAENQRAAHIARNVRSARVKEDLEGAADKAIAKQVEEVARDMRIYVFVDKSGSMGDAIEKAKEYLGKFVGAFPLERLHVAVFNTVGREIEIKAATGAAVRQAFRGHRAGGGTSYANGVNCLVSKYQTQPNEDALFFFVGDQLDSNVDLLVQFIRRSGVMPAAFGMLHIDSCMGFYRGDIVEAAAVKLGIPCFPIEERIFEDPYAVPRTIRNIIASTPVGIHADNAPAQRFSVIDTILETPLLQKPTWA